MSHPFSTWSDRIDAAADEHARRALLGEIGVWRAQRLMDLAAQRDASWALSSVYQALGETAQAEHEAEQLLALCRTPPLPPKEVTRFAERHAARVQAKGSGAEQKRAASQAAWAEARDKAAAGDHEGARRALRGRKGHRATMFRVWSQLAEALGAEGPAREQALGALLDDLAQRAGLNAAPREQREATAKPEASRPASAEPPAEDGPLEGPLAPLLGRPVPRRRQAMIDALDAKIAEDASQLDALAAAALRHHVGQAGPRAVAPWLVWLTARAHAETDATDVKAAIGELGDAYAVTAYREAGFGLSVQAWSAAKDAGHSFVGLRRGVLRRGVPDDRLLWTVRTSKDGQEGLVAVTPSVQTPWEEATAERVADRLSQLADRVVLAAPGDGHAALRTAAEARGVHVVDGTPAEAITALDAVPAAPTPPAAEVEAAPAPEAPAAPRAPDTQDVLREAFLAGAAPDPDALSAPLSALDRSWKAFAAIREPIAGLDAAEADRRLAPYLAAVDAASPEGIRLAEGASMAITTAAAAPGGAVETLLRSGEPAAARYGGAPVLGLVEVVRVLTGADWSVDRILLGITRREERTNPALGALARQVQGLWRVLVSKEGRSGEVWWMSDATPEARAAAPLLLLEDAPRVVTVAADQGLEEAVASASTVVTWSDGAADALRAGLDSWPAA